MTTHLCNTCDKRVFCGVPAAGSTHVEMCGHYCKEKENANPSHYKDRGVEPIDAMRAWLGKDAFVAYCRGNIIKYLARLGHKDDPIIEAQKAQVYMRWMVETLTDKPLSK